MFSLTRWQPNHHVARKEQSPDPFFGELFRPFDAMFRELDASFAQLPPVDISESDEALYVSVDVPGYESKDIAVRVEGDSLRICAKASRQEPSRDRTWHRLERTQRQFERAFTLPTSVDAGKTEASCKNGVLTITLPKRDDAKPKSISVKVQS